MEEKTLPNALGTYKDKETGEWVVAEIKFDPITGEAKVVERHRNNVGRATAIERFKILAVKLDIIA